jgi:hypothetical protein
MLGRGAGEFGGDRMKAFLFVGVAYFAVAIVGPLLYLKLSGKEFDFSSGGIRWSLFAGTLGAVGAFTLLIALNKNPVQGPMGASQVMSLIFAGAPVVAALYGIYMKGGVSFSSLDWRFVAGLVMAASGGVMVTYFKP